MDDLTDVDASVAIDVDELRDSDPVFAALLGSLDDAKVGVLVWEAGSVVWTNEAMSCLLGTEPSELVGQTESRFETTFGAGDGDRSRLRGRPTDSSCLRLVRKGSHDVESAPDGDTRVELYERVESDEFEERDGEPAPTSRPQPDASADGRAESASTSTTSSDPGESTPSDRERGRVVGREKALTDSVFDAVPDLLYTLDSQGNFLRWNDQFREVTGYTDDEIAEMGALDVIPPDDHEPVALAISDVLEDDETRTIESELVTKDGDRIPYEFTGAQVVGDDGTVIGLTGVGRDVRERKQRERNLQRQRDELRRLNRINAIVRDIDRELVEAETRDEIEAAVVERLVDADPYRFAVVGEFDPTYDAFTARAHAGDGPYFEAIDELSSNRPLEDGPGARSVKRGEVQVVQKRHGDQSDPWNQFPDDLEFEAVAAVPLAANDRVYGVLGLYAEQADAFDERERRLLEELGRNVGNTIHALETRRLLFADTVVELKFLTHDTDIQLVSLSRRCDCRLELKRVVPVADDVSLFYVDVYGEPTDRVLDAAASDDDVRNARAVLESDEFVTLELEVHGDPFTSLFVEYGARTQSFVAEEGSGEIVADVASGPSVRPLVEAVASTYPSSTLVAKRERDKRRKSPPEFRHRVETSWTDRQQAAVQAAFYAGYFEWPRRESSATDVADSFGVAPQTFHQHLRVAQDKLLTAFFEGPDHL